MQWDDLRIVLAVRNWGSYAKAAKQLKMDETTVARRIKRLERSLGISLFVAEDGERKSTPECEAIAVQIQGIEQYTDEIRLITQNNYTASTRIRIACTATTAEEILAPNIDRILLREQSLVLHFLTGSENINFSRWEADIAIRLRKPSQGNFIIRRLPDSHLVMVRPTQPHVEQRQLIICAYPETLAFTPEMQWLASQNLLHNARCISDNPRVLLGCLRSGKAIGIIPDLLAKEFTDNPDYTVTPLQDAREVWLLLQSHLKDDQVTRQVIDWIYDCFNESKSRSKPQACNDFE